MMRALAITLAAACTVSPVLAAPTELWTDPLSGIEFVKIEKGCFRMGVPTAGFVEASGTLKTRLDTERPEHEVCLDTFWIARTEVTRRQWHAVMGGEDPAQDGNLPVTDVTWQQARDFAARLVAAVPGPTFRLPTEAEWEHACRAGSPAVLRTPNQDQLDPLAWYASPYGVGKPSGRVTSVQPAGKKRANNFGLFDMLGNAWEWTEDDYAGNAYAAHALYNPVSRVSGENRRVIRGGGIRTDRGMVRCETRGWMPQGTADPTLGLRLVRTQ